MKILTIGGATQDIFLNFQGTHYMTITQDETTCTYMFFPSGSKIEVNDVLYKTGGGSTNSAVSFKRLGFETSCFCKIGSDQASNAILEELINEKIDTNHIIRSKQHPSAQSFIVNSFHGERTILVNRGASGYLTANDIPFDTITSSDHLYITSLSNESAKILPHIVAFAAEHKIPVAINPGSSQLTTGAKQLQESLSYIDLLILNSSEAKTFMLSLVHADKTFQQLFKEDKTSTSCSLDAPDHQPYLVENLIPYENIYFSMRNFFKEVLKSGTKTVVVTNGANGVYVAHQDRIYFHPSIKINVIDTVGTGDAFGSCFVASLLKGYTLEQALRFGIINAASVLSSIGAKPGLLSFNVLEERAQHLDHALLQIIPLT